MPGVHKPDCRCPACVHKRKMAALEAQNPTEPLAVTETPEYVRLAADYEQALEQIRDFQKKMDLIQQALDKADLYRTESDVLSRRLGKQRNRLTKSYARAVDLLRSTSIVYHRSEGHRSSYEKCPDLICREAVELWALMGELPGLEVATHDPDLWWDKKEHNEIIVADFSSRETAVEPDPEDIAEALDALDDGPEPPPEPEYEVVEASTLDEIPDSPAFAGKKVRVLVPSNWDRDDPGMPKRAGI